MTDLALCIVENKTNLQRLEQEVELLQQLKLLERKLRVAEKKT